MKISVNNTAKTLTITPAETNNPNKITGLHPAGIEGKILSFLTRVSQGGLLTVREIMGGVRWYEGAREAGKPVLEQMVKAGLIGKYGHQYCLPGRQAIQVYLTHAA